MNASRRTARFTPLIGVLFAVLGSACASVNFKATSPTGGTFTSSALAFTFLSFDVPSPALQIARDNAADSQQPNLLVKRETVFPYLGRLDWILDILCIRYARVTGTWGNPPEEAAGP